MTGKDSESTTHILGELSVKQFLREYWQQKPVLLKAAASHCLPDLSPDELAGFTLDDDCQARLVQHLSHTDWRLLHGPFDAEVFSTLEHKQWSLLVQNVDAMDIGVNEFLRHFRFLPNWRLDDIMVSYASDGAGVGPHFDYYDVFLVQGMGKRRWRIGQHCDANTELLASQEMKILKHFECVHDWEAEPGDIIYIPARIAHWGESIGDSMCYSIGFRAPSHEELLLEATQCIADTLSEDQRYRDGEEIVRNRNSALIDDTVLQSLTKQLSELVAQPQALRDWLGEYATRQASQAAPEQLPLEFASLDDWRAGHGIQLSGFNRAVYFDQGEHGLCFINGTKFSVHATLAEKVCNYKTLCKRDVGEQQSQQIESLLETHRFFVLAQ